MKKYSKVNETKTAINPKEYTPISVCRDYAIIEFSRGFLGKAILWRAKIRTLAYHRQLFNITTNTSRQFIDSPPHKIETDPARASLY